MQKTLKFKIGITLILLSTLLFASLLVVPFLAINGTTKISLSTVFIILGEITFWSGGILLGKEIFNKYKSWFNPMNWFKKKTEVVKVDNSGNENPNALN